MLKIGPRKETTTAAPRSARGIPQTGFASGSFPAVFHRGITNTLVRAIEQHSRPIAVLGRRVMPRWPSFRTARSEGLVRKTRDQF